MWDVLGCVLLVCVGLDFWCGACFASSGFACVLRHGLIFGCLVVRFGLLVGVLFCASCCVADFECLWWF